jgi:DmsE family decaheme c-type cytochrome
VGEAELNNIAAYYAAQPTARAQTPLIGDPSAGKAATHLCAGCHGEQGVSIAPAWPNLAGQDAQYLADAINAYKHGSRSKAISCAACHGTGGISKRPGTPNLAGLDPAYLVKEMKGYASGERGHDVMKALLSGLGETELNNIAIFYARQTPARAQTPLVGDPSAGKAASAACAGCHGQEGVSSNPMWPSLAGQDARYLADEIRAYKSGSRSDATMQALAAPLDDRTIDNIASYYASLQPAKPNLTDAMQAAPATREPVVVRNELVANLDERTINNIASYYATLAPAQPAHAKRTPASAIPARVGTATNTDGRSLEILSFRLNDTTHTVEEFNDVCLGCHQKGSLTLWRGSAHETRTVACVNCHTVMRNVTPKFQLALITESDVCFQCHKKQRSEVWQSSHMPIREGKMTCGSCHNPHGTYGESLLKTATVNDTCYKCHAEKRGPFLWEHDPVRENCMNCHTAHGSINANLLKVSMPRLCQQCHTAADHPGNPGNLSAIYSIGGACTNCHTKVHGSNSPAGSQLVR